jgi:dihydropteroate synthase
MLKSNGKSLSLSKPRIMGILNVTPDSFSDGGQLEGIEGVVERAMDMIEHGVDIIDVGGESTGPGSVDVSLEEELDRVIPAIKAIRERDRDVWISVDTWKSEVAKQAIEAGADMVNDIMALRADSAMAEMVAEAGVPIVLMYSKDDTPRTSNEAVEYGDVVRTISHFLESRVFVAKQKGIAADQIVVDPGMGGFVSSEGRYSVELLRRLREFEALGHPVLVGASRKGFIGKICGGDGPLDRLEGSLAAAVVAVQNGASIVRVHDVAATRRVLDFISAIG